jgi:hypothetical protein
MVANVAGHEGRHLLVARFDEFDFILSTAERRKLP